jgi:hypothetical protein
MTESHVLAAFGSPRSPSTGKPIKQLSGLRNIEGGARLYQAWKDIVLIVDNIDADQWLTPPDSDGETDEAKAGVPGKRVIRPAIEGFILNEGDGPKALFGAKGLTAFVKEAMTAHAEAVAKLAGVEAEAEPEASANDNAPQSLTDRTAALMVALQAADDAAFIDASEALAALSDYIDTRWNALADATNPDHGAAKAEGETATEAEQAALAPAIAA